MRCSFVCIDRVLKRAFSSLGTHIGTQPGYYIIVPLLVTAIFITGLQRIHEIKDPEYLFTPENGEAKTARAILEQHFPANFSQFDPTRSSQPGRFGRLLIMAADGGSLLRNHVWNDIMAADEAIRNVTILWEDEMMAGGGGSRSGKGEQRKGTVDGGGAPLSYAELCAVVTTAEGTSDCWRNEILDLQSQIADFETGNVSLTFPIWLNPDTFKVYPLPMFMGGFTLDTYGSVESVAALSLAYFLDTGEEWKVRRGAAWEDAFLQAARDLNTSLTNINITRFTSLSLEQELQDNTDSIIPYFGLNIGIMVVFCILTCMMTDWVRSKPLLGLLGVVSAILASFAAFGLCMYIGVDFIGINLAAPFLMLGIGIDDTFVILAAWRLTSVHDPVPLRMAAAYQEAAVSVTITSVTNMLSFFIGVITPFPCVKIFCIYTGMCVVFTYFWHITFFGGCLALSGYAEAQNRHSLTCCIITPKSLAGGRGILYRLFCTGGTNPSDPWNPLDNRENGAMVFCRDKIGGWLNKPWAKGVVLTLFLGYLASSCYGVTFLQEGLEKKRLSRFDSYSVDYYDMEDKYFRDYPFRINVVISGRLDYSSKEVQADLLELLARLENTTYIDPVYTESWLRSYLDYVERWEGYDTLDEGANKHEMGFLDTLQQLYLPGTQFAQDVDFETTPCNRTDQPDCQPKTEIVGSRFVVQGYRILNSRDEAKVVEELRQICHQSKYNVTVFHPYFIYFDQFLEVLPNTVQCVVIAAVVMIGVSIVFIPNPVCSLWVAFSIISIELGVLGYMAFWSVHLDSISMINLIMCIGFSVDFSAHISYHYLDSEGDPDHRVKSSLYGLGLPIIQGAISTILGVIGLVIAPSYIFLTFFKMIFLVIVLGFLHGLFLLPVLLSLFGPGSCSKQEKSEGNSRNLADSLSEKNSIDSKPASSLFPGEVGRGEEILKIPRPSTTVSLTTVIDTTDIEDGVETSGSSGSERDRRSAEHWDRSGNVWTSQPRSASRPLSLPRVRSFSRETSFQHEGYVGGTGTAFHRNLAIGSSLPRHPSKGAGMGFPSGQSSGGWGAPERAGGVSYFSEFPPRGPPPGYGHSFGFGVGHVQPPPSVPGRWSVLPEAAAKQAAKACKKKAKRSAKQ